MKQQVFLGLDGRVHVAIEPVKRGSEAGEKAMQPHGGAPRPAKPIALVTRPMQREPLPLAPCKRF
jgi:hypothetical protein